MALLLEKVFSPVECDTAYGFELDSDTYLGSRYLVTVGWDLGGLSPNEALKALCSFNGQRGRPQ